MAEKPDAEVLFWVGCTAALEQRSQAVARSMVKVLKSAGVDFAILGEEESCTGDPARRMGNEYLYQMLAQQNIEVLNGYNVKTVVTICPHCFNTMKNEYPQFGGNYEVLHYSQFVDGLISEGRVKPVKMMNVSVAYHDSCFLGRHNGIYDEPRNIAKAIPGLGACGDVAPHCRERGFCCGAGGGHMWIEESQGRAHQPRPHRPLPRNRRRHRGRLLPLLPPDDDRGHPVQGPLRRQRSPRRSWKSWPTASPTTDARCACGSWRDYG